MKSGAPVDATERALEELRTRFRGELVQPGDAGFDETRRVWNGLIDRRPALVARVSDTNDVVEALAFARGAGLRVAVRGGGHNVAGTAVRDGGLVVDLSGLNHVHVDPEARTARAGAGCTLGDLDAGTQAFGLAAPLGVVSETGIAGLTLGGGIGWLRRKHGLSSDNLVSLEAVTAAGEVVTASETANVDLFWALRGGGGGFVVVTSFEYRLHPVGPEVTVSFLLHPAERGAEVLRFVDELTAASGDDLSPAAFFGFVPHADVFPETHGLPYIAVLAVHPGSMEEGAAALAPLKDLGEPLADLSGPMPYVQAQKLLDEDYPDGGRYYWKSTALDDLGDEALERLAAHAAAAPSHHSTIDVWFHGGAMDRVGAEETAFGPRPKYLVGVEANWEAEGDDDANITWARAAVADLRRFSNGGSYLNFPGLFEEGDELLRAAHGERNYERLAAIRERYDPTDLFARAE